MANFAIVTAWQARELVTKTGSASASVMLCIFWGRYAGYFPICSRSSTIHVPRCYPLQNWSLLVAGGVLGKPAEDLIVPYQAEAMRAKVSERTSPRKNVERRTYFQV